MAATLVCYVMLELCLHSQPYTVEAVFDHCSTCLSIPCTDCVTAILCIDHASAVQSSFHEARNDAQHPLEKHRNKGIRKKREKRANENEYDELTVEDRPRTGCIARYDRQPTAYNTTTNGHRAEYRLSSAVGHANYPHCISHTPIQYRSVQTAHHQPQLRHTAKCNRLNTVKKLRERRVHGERRAGSGLQLLAAAAAE